MAYGNFSGDPKAEWLSQSGPDRDMRLLEDFWYVDPAGKKWMAPSGSVVNGASIPEALWSSVGSPYTGDYRRASIVHDVACDDASVNREKADEMFYTACLCGGCSVLQAKLLYAGVRVGAWAKSELPVELAFTAAQKKLTPTLPSQHSSAELVLRAKFTLIAQELAGTSDDFKSVKSAVDSHLAK
jgi:hypothetical protein